MAIALITAGLLALVFRYRLIPHDLGRFILALLVSLEQQRVDPLRTLRSVSRRQRSVLREVKAVRLEQGVHGRLACPLPQPRVFPLPARVVLELDMRDLLGEDEQLLIRREIAHQSFAVVNAAAVVGRRAESLGLAELRQSDPRTPFGPSLRKLGADLSRIHRATGRRPCGSARAARYSDATGVRCRSSDRRSSRLRQGSAALSRG